MEMVFQNILHNSMIMKPSSSGDVSILGSRVSGTISYMETEKKA